MTNIETNSDLINVVLRTADGKTSRIVGKSATGYLIEGSSRTVPAESLVRRGKVLVELDRAALKEINPERIVKMNGYIHIHSRDVMRQIKKGDVVDTPPEFTEWKRSTGPAKVIKPRTAKPTKLKSAKPVKVKPDAAKKKPDAAKKKSEVAKKAKPVPVSVKKKTPEQKAKTAPRKVERSTPVNRSFETAEQLFYVMENAFDNNLRKQFTDILCKSLNVDSKELPTTPTAIVEKYGVPKVRKAITAVEKFVAHRIAEKAVPRHMRKFVENGKLVLNKAQIKAVVAALSPTVPEEVLPHIVDRFFSNGEMELVRKTRKVAKVSGGE